MSGKKIFDCVFSAGLELTGESPSGSNYETITIGECVFTRDRRLGKGGFGEVHAYKDQYGNEIAIKFFQDLRDAKDEINIIKSFKDSCNIITSRILTIRNKKMIVMRKMDGSIADLEGKLDIIALEKLFKFMNYSVMCMYDKGYYYIDIKTDNVLYKKVGKGYKYFLGDIGSAINCSQWKKEGISLTFPSFNRKRVGSFSASYPPSLHDIKFGIALLILDLAKITNIDSYVSKSKVGQKDLKLIAEQDVAKFARKYKSHPKFVKTIKEYIFSDEDLDKNCLTIR